MDIALLLPRKPVPGDHCFPTFILQFNENEILSTIGPHLGSFWSELTNYKKAVETPGLGRSR